MQVPWCRFEAKRQSGERLASHRASQARAEECIDASMGGVAVEDPAPALEVTESVYDSILRREARRTARLRAAARLRATADVMEAARRPIEAPPDSRPGSGAEDSESGAFTADSADASEGLDGANVTAVEACEERRANYGPMFHAPPSPGPGSSRSTG